MKDIKDEELNNVNGGASCYKNNRVTCPKCNNEFDGDKYQVDYGKGCQKDIYYKCPRCNYEWR